jgi:hypothetical protein
MGRGKCDAMRRGKWDAMRRGKWDAANGTRWDAANVLFCFYARSKTAKQVVVLVALGLHSKVN